MSACVDRLDNDESNNVSYIITISNNDDNNKIKYTNLNTQIMQPN